MRFLLIFICFCSLGCSSNKIKSSDDVYIDGLVYNKSDSSLFTGALKTSDESSSLEVKFNKGMPSGDWVETDSKGSIIQKGTYGRALIEFDSLNEKLNHKIYLVNSWKEGQISYLTISIIEKDSFFSASNENIMRDYLADIFESINYDLLKTKYEGIYIEQINSVYDWDKSFYLYFDIDSKVVEFDKYGKW